MELESPLDAELDLLPEYCHYRDEGCELAASCLNCPFPECIFEQPGGKRKLLMEQRNNEIARQRKISANTAFGKGLTRR
jgi:hypothetical protein